MLDRNLVKNKEFCKYAFINNKKNENMVTVTLEYNNNLDKLLFR